MNKNNILKNVEIKCFVLKKKWWGDESVEHRGGFRVQGKEIILYDTVMVDASHYTFVQTHRVYIAKEEP